MQATTAQHLSLGETGEDFFLDIPSDRAHRDPRRARSGYWDTLIEAEFHTLAEFTSGWLGTSGASRPLSIWITYLVKNREGEQLPALRVRFFTLDFVQESVVFLNNGALKSTFAPAQRITGIPTYWGREMLLPALFDEFNHIFDRHKNLLTEIDAATTIESSPTL